MTGDIVIGDASRTIIEMCSISHKLYNTLRQILVRPIDKTPKENTCRVVYIKCEGWDSEYIGETEKIFVNTVHGTPQTTTLEVSRHLHMDCPGHTNISLECAKIY